MLAFSYMNMYVIRAQQYETVYNMLIRDGPNNKN